MCDGKEAADCDIVNLADFESTLNDELAKLDDQFKIINDILATKKEAFIKMYKKNPWVSQKTAVERRDTNQAIFSYCFFLLLLLAIIITSNIYCAILQNFVTVGIIFE